MAQSKSFFDHVKKELECSVCQEQFSEIKEPKILKCLHTFCKTCLEAWLRQQYERQMSCPTCRKITECPNNNIDSLPSNLFYKQMVEIVEAYSGQGQEADSPLCGNCEEKKTLKSYCFDCNSFLCEECAGAHKKWKIFRGHHVKEIGNFESSDMQDYARKANICKEHKDEFRFYCELCKICICRDCAILEHRDDRRHNIISLDQGLEKKKSDITNKMQDVEAIGCRLRDQKESLEKRSLRVLNSIDQTTDEVHRVAEHWISLIRQQESTMTTELLEQKKTFQAAFSAQMTSLDYKLMEIDGSLEFGKDVLERKNLPEILNVEEILEQRFQDLSSSQYEFQDKLNYSGVNFIPSNTSSIDNALGKLVITSTEPSLSIAQGTGLTESLEGEDCTFTIITKDSQGQTTYSEIDNVMVEIHTQTGRVTKPNITSLNDGRYEVKYRPEAAGIFRVHITVRDEAITGSPFHLSVKERMPRSQEGKEVKRQSSDPQHSPGENQSLKCHLCMYENIRFHQLSLCLIHRFCMSCRRNVLSDFRSCPLCADKNRPQGNQPLGHMSWRTETKLSLPNNKDCGTIIISYNFDRGVQDLGHPNPGVPYCCFFCPSYLPDNQEGRALCIMLRRAFNSRSLFTVGTSPSTGAENSIVCDGIELKTSQSGGPANCGYPDAGYLDRLKKQLAEKGFCLK